MQVARWAALGVLVCSTGASAQALVTEAASANALSTVSQRHMVRIAPPGRPATLLLAVQRDTWGSPHGLHWYRSDDEGQTWQYLAPIFDEDDGPLLHFAVDAIVVGEDVATVISYDTTETGFPSDSRDPHRKVYFQRWRHDGAGAWLPGQRLTVGSPPSGSAYHRALIARDSMGRLWVQAFLRGPCSKSAGAWCQDDLRVWVSTDGGASFQSQPRLARLPLLGGGRLLSLGTRMMMIWGDYSWDNPARYLIREDSAPLDEWEGPFRAFPDGDSVYHGAAMNAVADGEGGMHLVYKDRRERLYYRHFDGESFGDRLFVDGGTSSDWALQPAITLRGDELFVCTNHPTAPNQRHQMRMYRLSDGFSDYEVLDASSSFKGYPTAVEALPLSSPAVPCAYVTDGWPARVRVVTVEVPVETPPEEPPVEEPPPQEPPDEEPPPEEPPVEEPPPEEPPVEEPPPEEPPVEEPPPEEPAPPGTLAALVDDFTGPGVDATLWEVLTDTSGSTASASNGELALSLEPNTGAAGVHVWSRAPYALTGSSVHAHLASLTSSSAPASTVMVIAPDGADWDTEAGFWFEQGTLYLFYYSPGTDVTLAEIDHSFASHGWWRLRESAGTVFWETSGDGKNWVIHGQAPAAALGMDLDSVHLRFDVKAWSPGSSSPGVVRVRSLNR